jgi:hypothetical protein
VRLPRFCSADNVSAAGGRTKRIDWLKRRKEQSMRTAFAVSAALLRAGTAYVLPAHAQMAPQTPAGAPQTRAQPYGSAANQTQSNGAATQTQPWTAGQTQSGKTTPMQTQSNGTTSTQMGTQAQLPQGSYRSSCNDVRMQNDTLIAFCRKPDGTWQTSAIGPVNQCVGDIQNVNGQLTCNETGDGVFGIDALQ